MKTVTVDCTGIQKTDELWQRYVDAAQPESAHFFGRNLNAFWDAVERGGPGWPGEVELVFLNTGELEPLRNPDGTSFLDSLKYLAEKQTAITIRFA
jgi:hypothetical protein